MKKFSKLIFVLIFISTLSYAQSINKKTISLKGTWQFQIDPDDIGVNQKWYLKKLNDKIILPGSMNENNKGYEPSLDTKWTGSIYDSSWYFRPDMAKYRKKGNIKFPFWLTPIKHYIGAAWYQKVIEIPSDWKGSKIELFLERPHWETTVWIDSIKVGMQNSLSTPHRYDLSKILTPGRHTITIRIDNRIKEINVGPDSHSITDQTQGNWNGVVGEIYLKSTSPIFFEDIKLYPNINEKNVKAVILLNNITNKAADVKIKLSAESFNSKKKHIVETVAKEINAAIGKTQIEIIYPMGKEVQLWDEFNPALYKMKAVLSGEYGNDVVQIQFGMRSFTINGTRFEVNNRTIFLRGTVENCVFPLTGYPPTDVKSWERIFKICKKYGLNHMRFHSWCPPKAAFEAADKLGFYLQIEGPSWANHGVTLGDGLPIDQYIYDETDRILNEYGNHPSFCMMAYGNEPAGKNQVEYLGKLVNYWKSKDNRRVYTSASIGRSWPLVPESEFIVRSEPRGLPWDDHRPQSLFDYSERIQQYQVPYVVHEMGQHCVFPNFKEIKKYTGVYKAKNFELFQEELKKNHMGYQADDFLMASGKLQVLCYKSEIEAALRTKNLAGIQLLSLNDYTGQGTALVGVLDAFWDEKGYITAKEFRKFFGETVPLARIPKFVFLNNETFSAELEVFHFGKNPLVNVIPLWKITNSKGKIIAKGSLKKQSIPIGNCIKVGEIKLPLMQISKAEKLTLELSINNYTNDWEFWVYPEKLPELNSDEIYFCNKLDEKAKSVLKNGGKVFLHAAGIVENGKDVVQYLRPVFWNTSWFKMRPPHTLGILCNPKHPAFQDFPTEFHSNLQWWEILNRQQVMNLELFPPEFKPLIQTIDTWFLNRRLAVLFEAKVENGKLMVCSADLQSNLDERPAARQLLYSLTKYMLSNKFNPKYKVEYSIIEELFEKKDRPPAINFYTKQSTDDLKPNVK